MQWIYLVTTQFLTTLFISTLLLTLYMVIQQSSQNNREKMTPFECGFDPQESARLPFSLRFFMLAILFLIFDIEIALLMPIVILMKNNMIKQTLLTGVIFLMILLIGLLHEWKQGTLSWVNCVGYLAVNQKQNIYIPHRIKPLNLIYYTNLIMIMAIAQQKTIILGLLLILMTLSMTVMIANLFFSWYSFILFLIYITGLLVIFGYFLAISPNSPTNKKNSLLFPIMVMIAMFTLIPNNDMFLQTKKMMFEQDCTDLVTFNNAPMYWLIALILLMMLLIVVSITSKPQAPMRHFLK